MNTSLRLRLLAGMTVILLAGAAPGLAMAAGTGQGGNAAASTAGGQDGMLTPPVPGGPSAAKQAKSETQKAIDACSKLGSAGKIDSCLHSRVMVLDDENAMLKAQIAVAKSEQNLSNYGNAGGSAAAGGGKGAAKVVRHNLGIPNVLSIYGAGGRPLQAVLDYKGGKTLVVHAGQKDLPGGFSVKKISPDGVTLDQGGSPIRLLMTSGGSLQANNPQSAATALPGGGLMVPAQMTTVGDQAGGQGGDQGDSGSTGNGGGQGSGQNGGSQSDAGQMPAPAMAPPGNPPPAGTVVLRPGTGGNQQ